MIGYRKEGIGADYAVAVEHCPEGQADKPHPHVREKASAGTKRAAPGVEAPNAP
jgi:hypothetical protein